MDADDCLWGYARGTSTKSLPVKCFTSNAYWPDSLGLSLHAEPNDWLLKRPSVGRVCPPLERCRTMQVFSCKYDGTFRSFARGQAPPRWLEQSTRRCPTRSVSPSVTPFALCRTAPLYRSCCESDGHARLPDDQTPSSKRADLHIQSVRIC